jgi:tetratricopeptide (TPR) repeat protein
MAKLKRAQDDKVMEYYYKFQEYYKENKNRVWTIITIIIAAAAVVFIYFKNVSEKSETATLELSKVKPIYMNGAYDQAINGDTLGISRGLLYITNEYGSTESGETAKILLANSYYYLRNFDLAEKYYKDYGGSNEIYEVTSIAGVGAVLEAKGNYKGAAEHFEKAAGHNKSMANNDEYLFYAIRNYFMADDKESLKRVVDNLKLEYPKSKFIQQAGRYDFVLE